MIRPITPADITPVAALWYAGWREAHWDLIPDALKRLRDEPSFRERLLAATKNEDENAVRVCGEPDALQGFYWLKDDELYQFYVSADARGTGLAARLMTDALEVLRARGHTSSFLGCAVGNHRAAHFYEKHGWTNAGPREFILDTPEGPYPFMSWRFEHAL